MNKPGYSEDGDQVVLTMSRDDYTSLLMALGYGMVTAAVADDRRSARWIVGLVNRLNEGNPKFTPYSLGPEVKS